MAGKDTYSSVGEWDVSFKSFGLDFEDAKDKIQQSKTQQADPTPYQASSGYSFHNTSPPQQDPGHSASGPGHQCTEQWCGPPSALTKSSNSHSLDNAFSTSSSTWNKGSSVAFGQNASHRTGITAGGKHREAAQDDAKSDCSSCVNSCPSNCGDTGPGAICCDSDNCEEEDVCPEDCEAEEPCDEQCHGSEPCLDQHCSGASDPCDDEACFTQTFPQPAKGDEAAAAQALTSFGGQESAGAFNAGMDFFQNFQFDDINAGFLEGGDGGMNFGGGNSQFSDFNFHMDTMAQQQSFTQQQPLPQQNLLPNLQFPDLTGLVSSSEFWSHIRDFHDPAHQGHDHSQHMRPCIADHPLVIGHSCPFTSADTGGTGIDTGGQQRNCDFTIPDFPSFAEHLHTHHGSQLQYLGWDNGNAGQSSNNFAQGAHNCAQIFNGQDFGNRNFHDQGIMPNPNLGFTQAYQHPTPGSAATVPSLGNTPLPTPDSPMTSPSVDAVQRVNAGLQLPCLMKNSEDPQPPQAVNKPDQQCRPYGPEDAFRCFWRDHKTGELCLQNHENSDDLDAHCKAAHTKDLAKERGCGFRCSWEGCKRQNDKFTTRAKLNRHLQTHTGYKPMVCPYCNLRLSAKQALDQHIRTHTGEHPYVCKYGCGQKFKQHSALTMHHRVHTKEKPLECKVCGANFTESSNLSKHMRTHAVKGHFNCELCSKNFHRLDQLRRHLHANHRDQPEAVQGNLDRARDWKKKELRERRGADVRSESMSSAEPSTEISGMSLKDEIAIDERDDVMDDL